MYRDAEQHTDHSRQKKADPRPEQTAGFLTDGQKRSGAGEMVQREKNHADCRQGFFESACRKQRSMVG